MSIINEALKKAAKKKTHLADLVSAPAEGADRIFRLGLRRKIWQRKKWLFFGTLGGGLLISVVGVALFFVMDFPAENLHLEGAVIKSSSAVKETEILKPILSFGKKREDFVKLPNLVLKGIIEGRGKPRAIINSRVVDIGDIVEDATVVRINKNSVNLVYMDQEFILKIQK